MSHADNGYVCALRPDEPQLYRVDDLFGGVHRRPVDNDVRDC